MTERCAFCDAPEPTIACEDPGPVCRGCVHAIARLLQEGELADLTAIWELPETFDAAVIRVGLDGDGSRIRVEDLALPLRQAVWRGEAAPVLRLASLALDADLERVDAAEVVEALLAPSVLTFGGLSALRTALARDR